jgi:sRNA-binding regulator protein Hfq
MEINEKTNKPSPPQFRRNFQKKGKLSPEKIHRAREIVRKSNIPLYHAYMIVQGKTTLMDVLNRMLKREKIQKLVSNEGIPLKLAVQVADGVLSADRAKLIKLRWDFRKTEESVDIFMDYLQNKKSACIKILGMDQCISGSIKKVERYGILFKKTPSREEPKEFYKHDIAFICDSDSMDSVKAVMETDEEVKKLGLKGTKELKDRYRPDDAKLLRLLTTGKKIQVVLRDGTRIAGVIKWVSHYEICFEVAPEKNVFVFFHALFNKK